MFRTVGKVLDSLGFSDEVNSLFTYLRTVKSVSPIPLMASFHFQIEQFLSCIHFCGESKKIANTIHLKPKPPKERG